MTKQKNGDRLVRPSEREESSHPAATSDLLSEEALVMTESRLSLAAGANEAAGREKRGATRRRNS